MQEIEIKARLRDKERTMNSLQSLGCVFDEVITQDDVVYVEHVGSMETYISNKAFVRIRIINNSKILFTVKRQTGALVAIEHEVEIKPGSKAESKGELEKMLELMGYQSALSIKKTRIITHYDGCEICIDEVEGLGSFIEMERMSENGNPDEIQNELFKFFESIGIDPADRITKGYDKLILEKSQ